MADATVTFSDGSSHVYEDVPGGVDGMDVFYRARKDYPDKRVSGVTGVPQPSLVKRLKGFATTGQEDILTKDLPQLAMGAVSGPGGLFQSLGLTDLPAPKTPEDVTNRRAGEQLWSAIPAPGSRLEAPLAVRGALGRMVANQPRTLVNAARLAATAKTPPSTAAFPPIAAAAKALANSPALVKAAAAAGFGAGVGAVPRFLHWLANHAQ